MHKLSLSLKDQRVSREDARKYIQGKLSKLLGVPVRVTIGTHSDDLETYVIESPETLSPHGIELLLQDERGFGRRFGHISGVRSVADTRRWELKLRTLTNKDAMLAAQGYAKRRPRFPIETVTAKGKTLTFVVEADVKLDRKAMSDWAFGIPNVLHARFVHLKELGELHKKRRVNIG